MAKKADKPRRIQSRVKGHVRVQLTLHVHENIKKDIEQMSARGKESLSKMVTELVIGYLGLHEPAPKVR